MPISVDAIAIEKNYVMHFESTDIFKRILKEGLLFKQIENPQNNHKLYLIDLNRIFRPEVIQPHYYLWISVDDENNLGVDGQWYDALDHFSLDINGAMAFILKGLPPVRYGDLLSFYGSDIISDYELFLDKLFSNYGFPRGIENIFEIYEDSTPNNQEYLKSEIEMLSQIEQKATGQVNLEDLPVQYALNKLGIDCSYSKEGILVCTFTPNLRNYLNFFEVLKDEIADLRYLDEEGDAEIAYATYEDSYKLQIFEDLGLADGDHMPFPAIKVDEYTGEPVTGWS